jgi:hypothetical protein
MCVCMYVLTPASTQDARRRCSFLSPALAAV